MFLLKLWRNHAIALINMVVDWQKASIIFIMSIWIDSKKLIIWHSSNGKFRTRLNKENYRTCKRYWSAYTWWWTLYQTNVHQTILRAGARSSAELIREECIRIQNDDSVVLHHPSWRMREIRSRYGQLKFFLPATAGNEYVIYIGSENCSFSNAYVIILKMFSGIAWVEN